MTLNPFSNDNAKSLDQIQEEQEKRKAEEARRREDEQLKNPFDGTMNPFDMIEAYSGPVVMKNHDCLRVINGLGLAVGKVKQIKIGHRIEPWHYYTVVADNDAELKIKLHQDDYTHYEHESTDLGVLMYLQNERGTLIQDKTGKLKPIDWHRVKGKPGQMLTYPSAGSTGTGITWTDTVTTSNKTNNKTNVRYSHWVPIDQVPRVILERDYPEKESRTTENGGIEIRFVHPA